MEDPTFDAIVPVMVSVRVGDKQAGRNIAVTEFMFDRSDPRALDNWLLETIAGVGMRAITDFRIERNQTDKAVQDRPVSEARRPRTTRSRKPGWEASGLVAR